MATGANVRRVFLIVLALIGCGFLCWQIFRHRPADLTVYLAGAQALLDARGFREEDFALSHPGGALGRKLLTHVRDVMRSGDAVPCVTPETGLVDTMREMTRKGLGMTAIVDANARLLGVFTDGDLRRAVDNKTIDLRTTPVTALMTAHPKTITADKLFVLQLSAITADMGSLTAGTITGALIQTAASGARVALSSAANGGAIGYSGSDTYDPAAGTGTYQLLWKKTDGKLYAGTGVVVLDANGIGITGPTFSYGLYNASPVTTPRVNMIQWSKSSGSQAASILGSASAQLLLLADKITLAIPLSSSDNYGLNLQANGAHSMTADTFAISSGGATGPTALTVQTDVITGGSVRIHGSAAVGDSVNSVTRLRVKGASSTSSDYALVVLNSSSTAMLVVRNDNRLGFFGATEVARPTVTGSRGGNAALASALTALASLGLVTDSSTP